MLVGQFIEDALDQLGVVGALQSAQKVPELLCGQVSLEQVLQSPILDRAQVALSLQGLFQECFLCDGGWVQVAGQFGRRLLGFGLVVVLKVEFFRQALGVFRLSILKLQQELPPLDHFGQVAVALAIDPGRQALVHFVQLAPLLHEQAGIIIVFFGAGHQAFEGLLSVFGQGKDFLEFIHG